MMNELKYLPKFTTILSFFIMLICVMILFLGRTKAFFRIDSLSYLFPDFYQHISNFAISYLLLSGIGFMWLMLGVNFKYIVGLAITILTINFVYELWITVLNTPDIIDAYYGLIGTTLAFAFLALVKKFGLMPRPIA